jgi:hypothetical protein
MSRRRNQRPVVIVKATDRTSVPNPELSPSGVSMYTRMVARGVQTPRLNHAPMKARGCDHNTQEQLVEITQSQIRKCECDLRIADTPAERANVLAMIAIKQKFIATLRVQIAEAAS